MLNQNAGIGLKAQKAILNQDRIDGIINKISGAEQYDSEREARIGEEKANEERDKKRAEERKEKLKIYSVNQVKEETNYDKIETRKQIGLAEEIDTSKFKHNEDGTIFVARKVNRKLLEAEPFEVIDVVSAKGEIGRTYHDEYGKRLLRIDNNDHGQPKTIQRAHICTKYIMMIKGMQ